MNPLDKQEEITKIYAKAGYRCVECGESVCRFGQAQLAHRIANTKANRKKYGAAVIDHPLNREPTCGLYCNSKRNIAGNPGKCEELIGEINEVQKETSSN